MYLINHSKRIGWVGVVLLLLAFVFSACNKEKELPLPKNLQGADGVLRFYMEILDNDTADLDLHVVTPYGTDINYSMQQGDGGAFEFDCRCGDCTNHPWENIYWQLNPPNGNYNFYVKYYNYCKQEGGTARYNVYCLRDGKTVAKYSGILSFDQSSTMYTYTY